MNGKKKINEKSTEKSSSEHWSKVLRKLSRKIIQLTLQHDRFQFYLDLYTLGRFLGCYMFWLAPLVLRNIIESSHAKMFISRYLFTLKQPGLPCKLSKRNLGLI